MAYWGLIREMVPPRVMEVAKRRAGMWRGTKSSNIVDIFVFLFFPFGFSGRSFGSLVDSSRILFTRLGQSVGGSCEEGGGGRLWMDGDS